MNPGGEPERDETGLPPVDIEIPDDARELERDVQAYHRELRARRRRVRSLRLFGPLAKDGIVLPLLACCLMFALITGTLLTVFTAAGTDQRQPGVTRSPSHATVSHATTSAPVAPVAVVHPAARLPDAIITVAGKPVPLRDLSTTVLALVPAQCGCSTALTDLVSDMAASGIPILLVGPGTAQSSQVAAALTHGGELASDPTDALRGYPQAGLTAILISASGSVYYTERLKPGENLRALTSALGA